MKCNFNNKASRNERGIRMDNTEIGRNGSFWFLGSIIQDDGKLIENVINRIKAGWVKWRGAPKGRMIVVEMRTIR